MQKFSDQWKCSRLGTWTRTGEDYEATVKYDVAHHDLWVGTIEVIGTRTVAFADRDHEELMCRIDRWLEQLGLEGES